MSTQNLSSVAVHVIGQYNEAGKTLVSAYRTGAHRVLGGVASRFTRVQKATDFLASRLDIDTSRVVNVMDRVAAASTNGIEAVAGRAAQIESPVVTSVMNTVTTLNLPIATLSAQLADKVAEGAKAIEVRVSGTTPAKVVRTVKAKAKTVRRAVRKAV
ncbi:hypothetical protein [Variovorax sp. PAMC 28711]|uniref:hypothetical protein n=1 Tax=Variovorax sp. PAMC 28711 TaxID=1795631 RepID=UPI000A8A6492|nr:hypothetical protein [Variovorax sp. PAMC 28711]